MTMVTGVIEVVLYVLILVPVGLVIFDSLCRLLFLVIAPLPRVSAEPGRGERRGLKLLILVTAHDEEKTIERSLGLLQEQVEADGASRVAVLADHCADQTASIAAGMGALVYARSEAPAGKAEALSWFAKEAGDLLATTDIVAVLDADSLVENGFCERIRAAFRPGVEAVQSFVNPVSSNGFPLTTLVSFSEILSQKIDDAARSRLHWSVPLRGTGMAFRTATFERACDQLRTQVDDIEISVRLAELRTRVHFEPGAVVNDPKSDHALGLARQRGRWLRGQRQVWRTKGRSIVGLLRGGLPSWSLIQALLLKPKTALVAIRAMLAILLWIWPFEHTVLHGVLLWTVTAGLAIDALYYVGGVRYTGSAGKYLASLLTSPILVLLWALSWGYSLLPTPDWLRADEG